MNTDLAQNIVARITGSRRREEAEVFEYRRTSTSLPRWILLLAVLSVPIANVSAAAENVASPLSPRAAYNFNADWKLFVGDSDAAAATGFDDSRWKNVTLPHAWNEDSAFKVSIADLP